MKNCAIRAKGNTSLSNVKQYGNDRYSFKIEFDHYDNTLTYHGLDKLVLNNNIQDNTLMKDYLTYRMMAYMGVDAPLVSYAFITVNREDFGLYLALEAVEGIAPLSCPCMLSARSRQNCLSVLTPCSNSA